MTRILAAAILTLALCGCASVRDYATLTVYHMEGKVLLTARTPCTDHSDKPAIVMEFVREKDIGKMVVLCDAECNCQLVKRTPKMKIVEPASELGICR